MSQYKITKDGNALVVNSLVLMGAVAIKAESTDTVIFYQYGREMLRISYHDILEIDEVEFTGKLDDAISGIQALIALMNGDIVQTQADWNQTDSDEVDFIKNKPSLNTQNVYHDVEEAGTVNLTNNATNFINSEDDLDEATINFPNEPIDGDCVKFKFQHTITAITWANGDIAQVAWPTSAGESGSFTYRAFDDKWY